VLKWNGAVVQNEDPQGHTALPLVIPRRLSEEFTVSAHADGVSFFDPPNCRDFAEDHEVPAGWTIEATRGDSGHPGISEIAVFDDDQGRKSLEDYRYEAVSQRVVKVGGRICGVAVFVPANFERRYRVFLIRRD
jgi:hypothetical protein